MLKCKFKDFITDVHNMKHQCVLLNTLRLRQNGCQFPDNIFKCIFLNENIYSLIKISLVFVSKVWINNIPALVQIMAWRPPGDKPLSEQMMFNLLMHICITQWVNYTSWYVCININKHYDQIEVNCIISCVLNSFSFQLLKKLPTVFSLYGHISKHSDK